MAYLAAGKGRTAAMFTLFCPYKKNIMSMQVGKQDVFLGMPMNFWGVVCPCSVNRSGHLESPVQIPVNFVQSLDQFRLVLR